MNRRSVSSRIKSRNVSNAPAITCNLCSQSCGFDSVCVHRRKAVMTRLEEGGKACRLQHGGPWGKYARHGRVFRQPSRPHLKLSTSICGLPLAACSLIEATLSSQVAVRSLALKVRCLALRNDSRAPLSTNRAGPYKQGTDPAAIYYLYKKHGSSRFSPKL